MSRRGEAKRVLKNDERLTSLFSSFVIRISFVIRHLRFVIHFIGQFCYLLSVEFFQIKFVAICWKLVY